MKKFVKLCFAVAAVAVSTQSILVTHAAENTIKIGVVGDDTRVWDEVIERIEKTDNIDIELVKFSDYNLPNQALVDKELDLNSFQHQIFLDSFNEEHQTDLESIGNTLIAPLGIYSEKIKTIEELEDGATVIIPNDVTNGGRALRLLQSAGLIKVDPEKEYTPTVKDIIENTKNLKIEEVDAAQTARSLSDVAIAVINGGMAVEAGLTPAKDAIYLEPVDDTSRPYVNIIVARKEDANNELYAKIVEYYQSEETIKVIDEAYKGSYIAAWETYGQK